MAAALSFSFTILFPFLLPTLLSLHSAVSFQVSDPQWHSAMATWYGEADGDGSTGMLSNSPTLYLTIVCMLVVSVVINSVIQFQQFYLPMLFVYIFALRERNYCWCLLYNEQVMALQKKNK